MIGREVKMPKITYQHAATFMATAARTKKILPVYVLASTG